MILNNNSFVERQPVQFARNTLLERAREEDADYVWFFDDDQVAQFDCLKLLLSAEKDVVSGVVPLRFQHHTEQLTNIFHIVDGVKCHITDISVYTDPVIPIENCGTGCVLIKREVVDKMYTKYQGQCFEFQIQQWVKNNKTGKPERYLHQDQTIDWLNTYESDEKGNILKVQRSVSEDLVFFDRVKEMGYKLYAQLQVEVAHYRDAEPMKLRTHFELPLSSNPPYPGSPGVDGSLKDMSIQEMLKA